LCKKEKNYFFGVTVMAVKFTCKTHAILNNSNFSNILGYYIIKEKFNYETLRFNPKTGFNFESKLLKQLLR